MQTYTVTIEFDEDLAGETPDAVAVLVEATDWQAALDQAWEWFAATNKVEAGSATPATATELATLPTLASVM